MFAAGFFVIHRCLCIGTFISIGIQPEIPIEFGQNAIITCVDTGAMTPVNWSTTALSADLSNQQEMFSFESERNSELHLINVDSGYCGNYTCILPNSDMTGSIYVDAGKSDNIIIYDQAIAITITI